MPPSSDGGGGAAPERIPNARAVPIIDRVNPSHTRTLERRRLRGVGYIEPNDEIGQRPAVLLLPSLVAIGWIAWRGLNGQVIGWSSHPTRHPLLPTSTPVGRRECGRAWQQPRRKDILVLVRRSMSDFIEAI